METDFHRLLITIRGSMYPVIMWGYLMRIQAESIPPYDPPNAITGLSAAPGVVDFI